MFFDKNPIIAKIITSLKILSAFLFLPKSPKTASSKKRGHAAKEENKAKIVTRFFSQFFFVDIKIEKRISSHPALIEIVDVIKTIGVTMKRTNHNVKVNQFLHNLVMRIKPLVVIKRKLKKSNKYKLLSVSRKVRGIYKKAGSVNFGTPIELETNWKLSLSKRTPVVVIDFACKNSTIIGKSGLGE